jgi:predicted ATPase/DNA-binding SARP family transcriptional activator
MELRVLGPIQVLSDGHPIRIPSRAQRALLSRLAVGAGTVVPAGVLEDDLGLTPSALRTSVSRLRAVIGAAHLVTATTGYQLRPACLDAAAFEADLAVARTAPASEARTAIERALGRWTGSAFADVADEPWAVVEVARLDELRAGAVERLVELLLDAGEAPLALATLEPHLAAHPFRDRPQVLHLQALVAAGRRADALRAFQAHRHTLLEEIGTEPSPELVALDRSIAAGGPIDWLHRRATDRPAPSGRHVPELPAPLSSFVGRRVELATVAPLLSAHRLVTLTGAGGCGKTRLALELAAGSAATHPGGAWWAELSHVHDDAHLADQLALAAGLAPWAGGDVVAALAERIGGAGPALLVIDNAEHLVEPVAELVEVLVTGCPEVHVLVTSREPLGLAGELVWCVPSMAAAGPAAERGDVEAADSARLFLERARAARPDLVLREADVAHVVAICDGLDGLPLALELAAAQARTLPLEQVANGVDDAVRWLTRATHSPLTRHQTLHASIAWSVDLIGPTERSVLTRLTAFRGRFPLDAAVAVGAGDDLSPAEVVTCLSRLVDSSLLQLDAASARYRLLSTVRQFCLQRASGTDEVDRARASHAAYIARWCTEVGDGHHGIERRPFLREMPDVVAAMAWARVHAPLDALRMCAGLASVRSALGHLADLAETWAWLMAFDRDGEHAAEWATAVAAWMSSATAMGIDVSALPAEVAARLPADSRRARGWLERGAAMGPAYRGDLAPIGAYADRIVADEDDVESAIYVGFCAYMLALAGQLDESDRRVEQLRRVTRRQRAQFCVDTVGNGVAAAILTSVARGDLPEAVRRSAGPVPDDPAFSMTAATAIAHVALLTEDRSLMHHAVEWSRRGTIPLLRYLPIQLECCRALLEARVADAADLAEQHGKEAEMVPLSRVQARPLLDAALLAAGRADVVRAALDEAVSVVADMGDVPLVHAGLHHSQAQLALHDGRPDLVADHARQLRTLATAGGFRLLAIDALELLAAVAVEPDGPESRQQLLAAAHRERAAVGYRFALVPRGARPR